MDKTAILACIQQRVAGLLALYAFGSQVQGTAGTHSDLDLAVLVAGYADPLLLWELAGELEELAGCPVDLLDLRAASTVMQYQIIARGECWWAADSQAALYEAAILSEKTTFDQVRAELMPNDFLFDKAATIERCVARAREEYHANPASFATNVSRQDAAILNIQKACVIALDMGQHLIRRERLGVPQSSRDVFTLLAQAGWIAPSLAEGLKRMVGFRNIAVHDYQALQLPIIASIIEKHLHEFLDYSKALLLRDADSTSGVMP
jgi:uncharacterized protein YutE (UPF0331/DUF86 family)/predicted nucleotidyltransferase